MPSTFSVLQVAEHIERQVADVWNAQFWVRGEVSGMSTSARGMVWFDLVQTAEDGTVVASLNVTMIPMKARLVERRLRAVGQPLEDGLEVRIKANLSFYVRGGRLSLSLADIDPAHTVGAVAVARRDLLQAMQADGSLHRNRALPTPRLPLRLGLVTSAGSQAYHDLVDELRRSGLPFVVVLAPVLVQGPHAPPQISAALQVLGRRDDLDLVLLTRGGGADVDLLTFDHVDVARAVADCPLPVWSGIGHHLDSPVAEQVAARPFKTPTALGQGIVSAVLDAGNAAEALWDGIRRRARARVLAAQQDLAVAAHRTSAARVALRSAAGRLDSGDRRVQHATTRALAVHAGVVETQAVRLHRTGPQAVARASRRLDRAGRLVDAADPTRLIDRGWTLTTDSTGRLVTGPVPAGTLLLTRTRGGPIRSRVVTEPAGTIRSATPADRPHSGAAPGGGDDDDRR